MRAVAVVGLLLIAGACGATDVTESSEYLTLIDERDSLATDLETLQSDATELEIELDDTRRELLEVNDELATAGDEVAESLTIKSDFIDYLALRFSTESGLNEQQSECVGNAIVNDSEARQAFLTLLSSSDPSSAEVTAADLTLTTAVSECDLDDPTDQATAPVTPGPPAEVLGVIRPVTVVGDALPRLETPDINADPAVGAPAPVLVGEGYDGEQIRIDAANDGPTMVVFLAHWCPHCNAEMPRLTDLRDEGLIPEGINVVAISSAVNPDGPNFPPDEWLEQMAWTFPTLVDGIDVDRDVYIGTTAFGVSGFPFVTLIDGDGNVAARWAGERDPSEVVRALTDHLVDGG